MFWTLWHGKHSISSKAAGPAGFKPCRTDESTWETFPWTSRRGTLRISSTNMEKFGILSWRTTEAPSRLPSCDLRIHGESRGLREHGRSFFTCRTKIRSTFLSSSRDAEDAVFGRNGYGFGDCKLRVEYPRSSGSKFSGPAGGGPRGRFGPPTRRSEFRVVVTGELRSLRLHARIIQLKIVLITLLQWIV